MRKFYLFLLPAVAIAAICFFVFRGAIENEGFEEDEEYDGPDKAMLWQMERTKDPATGIVPSDQMWQAVLQTQQMKNNLLNSPSSVSALTWAERGSYTDVVGPSNGNTRANNGITSGRIDAICVDAADPTGKTVWIGGRGGGIWKTTDITAAPATWTIANDFMGNLSIAGICQDPTNTNTMYVCTGESYFEGGALQGNGVFKSTDHGVTWNQLSSTTTYTFCTRILCDNTGNIYLGTRGNGLLRSTNGGTSWTDITPTGLSTRICDLDLSSTGRLHVATGIFSASSYRYTDNPATVTTATWTAPVTAYTSFNQRTEIGVSGNNLYAIPANGSYQVPTVWKSTDGGANWTATTTQPTSGWASGQGWYALTVAINPADPNQCIVGGLDNYRTLDGGASWVKISAWVGTTGQYVHADQHASVWYDNGNKLLFGCDGGIHISTDGGTTMTDRNAGLRLKQFYSCAIHPSSTNYFLAGAQDNGTHQLNGAGLTSSVEVTGGDGAYVDIDQDQPQYQFGAYVYNQYRRSTNGGASWSSVNFSSSAGQFINPFDYDDVGNRMYCSYSAGQYLRWENPQTGNTFTPISIASFAGGSVFGITVSPYTANRVYFGTNNGRVVRVDNADQATPTETAITAAGMPSGTINSISVGSNDQNLVACYTNYNVNNVWVTNDGGTTWSQCDGNLPNVPVYSAIFHPDNAAKMIIATETGVWETDQLNGAATVWVPSVNFPTVRTTMLRYRSSDRTLLASTYGRGLWTTNIPNGCTTAGITTQPSSASGCAASNATFSITATGVSYQWQESTNGGGTWNNITNGGIYSGAATTTLTLTGITAGMNNYQYRCVVTGDCSPTPVNSNAATLTVTAVTSITAQPAPSTICAGLNTSFNVAATGASLTYQWQVSTDGGVTYNNITNGGVYTGATTTTLSITGATAVMNSYRYRCVVSGTALCGAANSNAAILSVNNAPAAFTVTGGGSYCAGGTGVPVGLSNSVSGVSYQLQLNGINNGSALAGNGAALSFGNKTTAGVYTVVATNTTTSCAVQMPGSVTVAIYPQPTVTLSVSPYQNVFPGLTTTLTATAANGTSPYTYNWFKGSQSITNSGNTYAVNITNMGSYRVVATDANGCVAQSQVTTIADSANNKLFIYPSPNDGRFNVVYYNVGNTTIERTLAIFSAKGEKVYYNKLTVSQPYQVIQIDLRRNGAGVYYVVLGDANGAKLKTGEVLIR